MSQNFMGNQGKFNIKCPECFSTSVRKREVIYKSGTSEYSGKNSSVGVSFGLRGRARPRVFLGSGKHSGKRQSKLANEAQPISIFPAIIIIFFVYLFSSGSGKLGIFSFLGLMIAGLIIFLSLFDRYYYKNSWICGKCGNNFIQNNYKNYEKYYLDETLKNNIYEKEKKNIYLKFKNDYEINGLPKKWGVYKVPGSKKVYRFGNHPIRQKELEKEFSQVEIVDIFEDREIAKKNATQGNTQSILIP